MNVRDIATSVVFLLFLSLAPQPSHAAIVQWQLVDVKFSAYFPVVPRPIPNDHITATGSITVDTRSHQMTDWGIQLRSGSTLIEEFTPRSCYFPDEPLTPPRPCGTWTDRAFIGSGEWRSQLDNAASFEFDSLSCSHCRIPTLSLVSIQSELERDKPVLGLPEEGGVLPLASGAFYIGEFDPYDNLAGFVSHGSLIGTLVPEPRIISYLGIAGLIFGGVSLWRTRTLS